DDRAGCADHEEAPRPGSRKIHAVGNASRAEVRRTAHDLRLVLRGAAGSAHLSPLLGDPGAHVLLGGPLFRTRPSAEGADQLPGVSSHVVRLRASAAAAIGRRSESRPTAASTE